MKGPRSLIPDLRHPAKRREARYAPRDLTLRNPGHANPTRIKPPSASNTPTTHPVSSHHGRLQVVNDQLANHGSTGSNLHRTPTNSPGNRSARPPRCDRQWPRSEIGGNRRGGPTASLSPARSGVILPSLLQPIPATGPERGRSLSLHRLSALSQGSTIACNAYKFGRVAAPSGWA